MPATIEIISKSDSRTIQCGPSITVGREETNDIPLDDPKASRSHASFRILGDGKYYIMDMGSSNGTFINDVRVVAPCVLRDGDEVKIGNHTLVFRCDDDDSETHIEKATDETMVTFNQKISNITVLVSDIRGYTDLSTHADPNLLSSVLGAWCRAVSENTEKHGGVVDKFIGDCVMARWVISRSLVKESVMSALRLGHDINVATEAINQSFPDLPKPLAVGVGINTGQAILGSVGGSNRRDYTAIGDSVNIAFRLESASKDLGCDVVLGESSYKHLPTEIWENSLETAQVKGKKDPLKVCALKFEDLAAL